MRRRHGRTWTRIVPVLIVLFVAVASLTGCSDDMRDQPRLDPLEATPAFPGNAAALHPPDDTVPRRIPGDREPLSPPERRLATGQAAYAAFADPAAAPPRAITDSLLARGRERFDIFCAPCHGVDGYGDGPIARRGFPQPASYHTPRLRAMPDAVIFAVITTGRGKMPPYGPHVPPDDRWAIVAYLRALQRSQHATLADAPDSLRAELAAQRPVTGGAR